MEIDRERGMIWGAHGSAMYFINNSGGLELVHEEDGGLTDKEFETARKELEGGNS